MSVARFKLFWRRKARVVAWYLNGGGAAIRGWEYWESIGGNRRYMAMKCDAFADGWMRRGSSRLYRYYAGIPVFKRRTFL